MNENNQKIFMDPTSEIRQKPFLDINSKPCPFCGGPIEFEAFKNEFPEPCKARGIMIQTSFGYNCYFALRARCREKRCFESNITKYCKMGFHGISGYDVNGKLQYNLTEYEILKEMIEYLNKRA